MPDPIVPDLIDRILPGGKVSLFCGATGVGKTALMAGFVRAIRDGVPFCGHQTASPPEIGIIVGDRAWSSHRQWFDLAGCEEILHYSLEDDDSFQWDRLTQKMNGPLILIEAILKLDAIRGSLCPPGTLVVVDPIALYVGGDLLNYHQVAVALGKIKRYCRKRGITLIGTAHMSKQRADVKDRYLRPQDRILGTTALAGYSDTQMFLLAPEEVDDDYYLFGWVPHHAPPETFHLSRDQRGLFVPYASERDRLQSDRLLPLISEEPVGTATTVIIEQAGEHLEISGRTTYRLLNALHQRGLIEAAGKGRWRRTTQQ